MKKIMIVAILLTCSAGFTREKQNTYKHWKTFRSDYGFEFKYPDVFDLTPNDVQVPPPVTSATKEIYVKPNKLYKSVSSDPNYSGGLSIEGGWNLSKPPAFIKKLINGREKDARGEILRQDIFFFKHLKLGTADAIITAERVDAVGMKPVRWTMTLYYPQYKISVSGPSLSDLDGSFAKKFADGDMALPEPEKSIYQSFRCVPAKK